MTVSFRNSPSCDTRGARQQRVRCVRAVEEKARHQGAERVHPHAPPGSSGPWRSPPPPRGQSAKGRTLRGRRGRERGEQLETGDHARRETPRLSGPATGWSATPHLAPSCAAAASSPPPPPQMPPPRAQAGRPRRHRVSPAPPAAPPPCVCPCPGWSLRQRARRVPSCPAGSRRRYRRQQVASQSAGCGINSARERHARQGSRRGAPLPQDVTEGGTH